MIRRAREGGCKAYTSCCYISASTTTLFNRRAVGFILPVGPGVCSWHVGAPEILKVCLLFTHKDVEALKIIDVGLIQSVKSSIAEGYLTLTGCSEGSEVRFNCQ